MNTDLFLHLFYGVSFLLIDFALLLIVVIGYNNAIRIFPTPLLTKFIFYFIAIKIGLYYILPTFLRLFSGYQFEQEDGVQVSDLLLVYLIELFSWLFWMGGFFLVGLLRRKLKGPKVRYDLISTNVSESKHLLLIIGLGFIVQTLYSISLTPPNAVFALFGQLFFYAGLAVGPVLLLLSNRLYKSKLLTLIGLICLGLSILSLSTRGAIVYSALFICFIVFFIIHSRAFQIKFMLWGFCFLILFGFTGSALSRIKVDENGLSFVSTDLAEKSQGRTLPQEIEWRFGAATRYGTGFITLYREGVRAGSNPIRNSLVGFLPRSIDPDKPHPSTLDGNDFYSQGMYLIMGRITGVYTNMVEFPTGCHFFWEFGIGGIVFLSVISGMYIGLCYYFLEKIGLVGIPLMLAVFKPWGYVDPKIWVSDIAMQLYQILLPLGLIILLYRTVSIMNTLLKTRKIA